MANSGCRTLVLFLLSAGLTSCHADTNQGGGADRGHAATAKPTASQHAPIPTPPSADRVDPNSPQAILDGTSTTRPGKPEPNRPESTQHQH